MATVTPTITQVMPNVGKKMVYWAVTCSASDTFSLSTIFSSIETVFAFRTLATGTAVTCTASGTTVTVGSGPSAEAITGFAVGVA